MVSRTVVPSRRTDIRVDKVALRCLPPAEFKALLLHGFVDRVDFAPWATGPEAEITFWGVQSGEAREVVEHTGLSILNWRERTQTGPQPLARQRLGDPAA